MTATVERLGAPGAAAVFSEDGAYRYRLRRRWEVGPLVTFVMLNPSTADHEVLDPTVRRCVGFAQREGAGALEVVNVFALRSTDPKALYGHPDPIGPGNDEHILTAAAESRLVIAAWGHHPAKLGGRGEAVRRLLADHGIALHHLGLTKDSYPRHPLYLPAVAPLTRWELDASL